MSSRKMTINLSTKLNKKLGAQIEEVKQGLSVLLKKHGFSSHARDLVMALEELSPKMARDVMSRYLQFIQPTTLGMGFRVVRLTANLVELRVSPSERTRSKSGFWRSGVIASAAQECVELLWEKQISADSFKVEITQAKLKLETEGAREDLIFHLEFDPTVREEDLYKLRSQKQVKTEHQVMIYNEQQHHCGEVKIHCRLHLIQALKERG